MELLGLGGTPEEHPVQFPTKAGFSGAGCIGIHPGGFGMIPDPMASLGLKCCF